MLKTLYNDMDMNHMKEKQTIKSQTLKKAIDEINKMNDEYRQKAQDEKKLQRGSNRKRN